MKKLLWSILLLTSIQLHAQSNYPADSSLFKHYTYRNIGPFRGGRASGVCGDSKNKQVFYMGSTGGGVWQTKDGGSNWKNISDKYFGGSIGSIEVSAIDPLIIYVGAGENTLRGNVSEGNGMWKSKDGGKTWSHIGLDDTRHITKIIIHPKDHNIVYCAAIGHLFGPNEERGVFKTINGGKTWEKVLFVNDEVGAVDMAIDFANPDILYASTWRIKRTPYSLESGGEGSGLWKSTDAGQTWKNISKNKGFPKDTLGIIGLSLCASNTDKLYAMVESKSGGLFVSNDAGETWSKQNDESNIRQRAWYFSKISTDPKNDQIVYVGNVEFYKSTDGGKNFQSIGTPHGDHHNLWIDPEDGKRMIIADDGGAQVSFDGGQNWSTYQNQPTAQFYRVTTDNHFPYRILGCQQDNSSVRILSRTYDGGIGAQDWTSTAGFESGHIAVDPLNDDIVYGGNYGGYLSRLNHKTGENRTVSVYPVSPIGEGADTLKYRFQWNFPILFSPHNPKKLYAAANKLFVTEDEGQSWKAISPDLTTNDKSKQVASGGTITKDNTGVEYYCTVFAVAESKIQKDVIWCGSDDGLIHVTKDGGQNWKLVNPKGMPEWMMINCIEPSPFDAATCYVVGTRYKLDDETPYIYKTEDFGVTWKKITNGIDAHHFTRCLRADPNAEGTLYCGTEQGMYMSEDNGLHWKSLQLNLPVVPITDLTIKNDDLIVATQGRSFWVLDQLTILRQLLQWSETGSLKTMKLLTPATCYRMNGYQNKNVKNEGMNPPNGIKLDFYLPKVEDSTKLEISFYDEANKLLRTFKSGSSTKSESFSIEEGMNTFVWNLQVKGVESMEGMILWNGNIGDYKIPPGKYFAQIKNDKDSIKVPFAVMKDPNYEISESDYKKQYTFLGTIKDKFEETQKTIKNIRNVKGQITSLGDKMGDDYPKDLDSIGKSIIKKLNRIEEHLYQTKAKSGQDVLNYPIRLNDKLSGIFDAANQHTAPTQSALEAYDEIKGKIDKEIDDFKTILQNEVKTYNNLVHEKSIDLILLKKDN
ncbi:MAG: glycosyl hydrolase [Bacteroidetes bacterium]|nr:glycosyl hydrolase [Bacteroidota bacterium]